jgi:hypothetical protein
MHYINSNKEIKIAEIHGKTEEKLAEIIDKLAQKFPDVNYIKNEGDDFSDKPLTLTYVNDELRQQMIHDKANNPFNIYYIVSGELVKAEKNSKIIAYRVLEIIDTIIE